MLQDFSGQNLRGRSFKGQDLTGADFSGADIRSANFTDTKLKGANFSYAKAGLLTRFAIRPTSILPIISTVSVILLSFGITLIVGLFVGLYQITGWSVLIVVIIIILYINLYGADSHTPVFTVRGVAVRLAIGLAVCLSLVGFTSVIGTTVALRIFGSVLAIIYITMLVVLFIGLVAVFIVIPAAGVFVLSITTLIAITEAAGGILVVLTVQLLVFSLLISLITASSTIDNVESVFRSILYGSAINQPPTSVFLVLPAVVSVLISIYTSWRVLKRDKKYALICDIAIPFATIGGTSFRNADLTDVDFTGATLKSTDFRKAVLTRTCFHKTKNLDRVRPGTTYLQKTQVCQVLVAGRVQNNNFDHLDLYGVNFKGASLVDASFIGADLSKANLQDADLSRAKLVQAQLDGTDFTGATLTGAYIQDWGITSDTKFDGVQCEYVYMRLPTIEDPDPLRKPDNREEVFADGEFGDFIKPIVDTLDLYHSQGVDPRAIAISFKQLAEKHPDAELEIVAMEKRGQDKFLLRAKTAPEADKSQLSQEYFEVYNQIKALAEQDIQKLIAEKDSRIHSLETMVVTALQRPSFYAETYQNQGDTMSQSPKKQSTFNLQNAQFGGGLVDAETVNAEQIGGNIINYSEKQNLAEAASEIQQLLTQLQNQGSTTEQAQQQVAQDLAKKADNDPTVLGKLVKWGQSLGNTAANTTVTEAAKEVFKIALRLLGLPIP